MFKQSTIQFHRCIVRTTMSHGKHGMSHEANALQQIIRYQLPRLLETQEEWWTFAILNNLVEKVDAFPAVQFMNDNHLCEVVAELNKGRNPARIECREGQNVHWFRQSASDRSSHAPPPREGMSEYDVSYMICRAAKRTGGNILLSEAINLLWSSRADRTKFNENTLHRNIFNWSKGRINVRTAAEGLVRLFHIDRRDRHDQRAARHSGRHGDRDVPKYAPAASSSAPWPSNNATHALPAEVSNDDYVMPN